MRSKEIIIPESIRMGASQLKSFKKDYTIGFEFEVAHVRGNGSDYGKDDDIESDGTSIGILNDIRDQVRDAVGGPAPVVHIRYHQNEKSYDKWVIEPDGSIKPDGGEIVSPIFNVEAGIEAMHDIFSMISESDTLYTNYTTGLHVNIGTWKSKEEWEKIDLLKFFLIIDGERILHEFGRSGSEYTENNLKLVVYGLQSQRYNDYKAAIAQLNTQLLHIGTISRGKFMNLMNLNEKGYIEIRAFGEERYETKGQQVEKYIRMILRALDIASDPTAYREEYLKKLYKFVGKQGPVSHKLISKIPDEVRRASDELLQFVRDNADTASRWPEAMMNRKAIPTDMTMFKTFLKGLFIQMPDIDEHFNPRFFRNIKICLDYIKQEYTRFDNGNNERFVNYVLPLYRKAIFDVYNPETQGKTAKILINRVLV